MLNGVPMTHTTLKERRKHIDDYSRGARIAIRSVLLSPHECDGSWDRKTWYDEEENKEDEDSFIINLFLLLLG